jgi:hypothetical protein
MDNVQRNKIQKFQDTVCLLKYEFLGFVWGAGLHASNTYRRVLQSVPGGHIALLSAKPRH